MIDTLEPKVITKSIPGLETLSFSKIKNFLKSPKDLWKYINREKEPTDAMIQGSLLDCLLFEPHKFDLHFYLMPKIEAFTKDGKPAASPMATDDGKAQYAQHVLNANGRMIVKQSNIDQANVEINAIKFSSTVKGLGLLDGNYQTDCAGEIMGWNLRGKIDIERENGICDLKRVKSADPEIIRKDMRYNNKYHLQAYIYQKLTGKLNTPYHLIAIDSELNVEVFNIQKDMIENGEMLLKKAINRLNKEISSCQWLCDLKGDDVSENYWKSFFNKTYGYWAENSDGTFDL